MRDDSIANAIVVIVFIAMFFFIGLIVGRDSAKGSIHREAVEKGHAEWAVIDSTGATEFRWKEINVEAAP
jgi:hypothetical protein